MKEERKEEREEERKEERKEGRKDGEVRQKGGGGGGANPKQRRSETDGSLNSRSGRQSHEAKEGKASFTRTFSNCCVEGSTGGGMANRPCPRGHSACGLVPRSSSKSV